MKNYKKLALLVGLLLVLSACTNYYQKGTNIVDPKFIITWGDSWNYGKEGLFATFLVWPLAQLINFFAQYVGPALSITVVTILIHALTFKSSIKATLQQQAMQELAPEQKKIEDKYKDRTDQQSLMQKNQEMQNLWKKHGINPIAGMGSMLLQLPIMIAMYQAAIRAQSVVVGTIFGQPLEATPKMGFQTGNMVYISIFVLMAVIQAASMLLPQYLTRKKLQKRRPNDVIPKQQGSGVMIGSIVMIVYLAFIWNIGMNLYYMISAGIRLIQTLYIQYKYGN